MTTYPYCTAGEYTQPCRVKAVADCDWRDGGTDSFCRDHADFTRDADTALTQLFTQHTSTRHTN